MLAARLLGYGAEELVLTEFQEGRPGRPAQRPTAAGYVFSYARDADPTRTAVAVASRRPIIEERPFAPGLDPRHLWCLHTAGIGLCAAYVPVPTEERVLPGGADRRRPGPRRRGNHRGLQRRHQPRRHDLDAVPAQRPARRLVAAGYTDLWRHAHPEGREYSYYSREDGKSYNGFRIDRAYADPELLTRVVDANSTKPAHCGGDRPCGAQRADQAVGGGLTEVLRVARLDDRGEPRAVGSVPRCARVEPAVDLKRPPRAYCGRRVEVRGQRLPSSNTARNQR
jgi:hypothetical protein